MAIYTPQAQRRRQLVIVTVVAFLLGGLLGGFVGRILAPTPADRVASVREQARQTSSQLRVLSVHFEDNAASLAAGGDAGAGLALQRADDDLTRVLQQAPWVTTQQGTNLLNNLHGLEAAVRAGATKPPFASNVDRLAQDIDTTFGLASPAS
ncbi:MAG TPA: hypothetical protein VN748_05355 [Pseudonocardiaceae bacterium]|jgi:hypothetical protein|nr:hypothetical protein [Pseudonocardiaceae bacterium]